MKHLTTDVLVIGGGLAGLCAASRLLQLCTADVLIVADGRGASPWVHGFSVPLKDGDSAERFYEDTVASGRGAADERLVRVLCEGAKPRFDELLAAGYKFNTEGDGYQLLNALGSSYPRVVSIGNETGATVQSGLLEVLSGKAGFLNGRALKLRVSGGRVAGALIYLRSGEWATVAAKAVILACGGFCGIYAFSTNKRDSGGDGVAMAYNAGCRVTGMEFVQFEPSAAVWPAELRGTSVITTLYSEGAVLRDKDGVRFMAERDPVHAELVNKDVQARAMAGVIASGRGTPHGGVYFDATGVDPELLAAKYSSYLRRYADVGVDITKEPMEVAPAPHTSLGGVVITPECRADLAGLYACGEVAGGVHGANRIGGNAGLETLVFGELAGETCAADLAEGSGNSMNSTDKLSDWDEWTGPLASPDGPAAPYEELRRETGEILQAGAGVIRNETGLRGALEKLAGIRRTAESSGGDAFERLRTLNDLTAAELVCRAALARRETLGCHVRDDS